MVFADGKQAFSSKPGTLDKRYDPHSTGGPLRPRDVKIFAQTTELVKAGVQDS